VAVERSLGRSQSQLNRNILSFAREGYLPAALPAITGLVLAPWFGWWFFACTLALAALVLAFFRDPKRIPPSDLSAIVAPADGRVLAVEWKEQGHRLCRTPMQRISIFMSPLDVHINRIPVAGVVRDIHYSPGQFRAAYADDASDVNESNALLVESEESGRFVVVQIAGWLARRIVCKARVGEHFDRCEKFGLIMFGSRVDLYLPADVSVCVNSGERVSAGSTVVARAGGDRAKV
jgi:phosphatidylserine decarboxylase